MDYAKRYTYFMSKDIEVRIIEFAVCVDCVNKEKPHTE